MDRCNHHVVELVVAKAGDLPKQDRETTRLHEVLSQKEVQDSQVKPRLKYKFDRNEPRASRTLIISSYIRAVSAKKVEGRTTPAALFLDRCGTRLRSSD